MQNIERWVRVAQMVETARDGTSTVRARVAESNRVVVPVLGMAMVIAVMPAIANEAPPSGVSLDTRDDVHWVSRLQEAHSPLVPGIAMTALAPRLPASPVVQARASRHPVPAAVRADAHTLLHAVGVPHEDGAIYGEDLVKAGEKMGKTIAPDVDVERVEYLLAVHRNQAGPAVRAAGVNPGTRVDPNDIARAAHAMGLKVGRRVDPSDVERLKDAVRSRWKQNEARRVAAVQRQQRARTAPGVSGRILAKVEGITLVVPSNHARLVGFHQAAYRVARNMRPGGGRGMTTLPSRGRGTGRQTAADVSVPKGTPVVSPVSGRVVEVRRYRLYGRYPDVRIRIVPYSNPHRLVTVLHVSHARVRVGSRVEAGKSVIAAHATPFPFRSQIDKYAGRYPHIHVEVRRR